MSAVDGRPALADRPGALDAGEVAGGSGSARWLGLGEFARNWQARAGFALVLLIVVFCVLGPLVYHSNQTATNLNVKDLPPGAGHPLGTDDFGFDVLGRLMVGGQSSLELGFAVAALTTVVGTLYGAIAGISGGIVDGVMMRALDTLLAIPSLVFLLIVVTLFPPNLLSIILVLSLLSWLGIARLVRGEVLSLRTRDFVLAAKTMGSGTGRLMWRHMMPNALSVIIVNATFSIADAITAMATLSFLGLGMPPPYADWGQMLNNGVDNLFNGYWWEIYPPAILLVLTIIGFSLIGDAVRDSLDVRLRR
ncbi:MAG TPA: ABC transporter permease, partial [Streptosporangiaceae bacterium]|nr:ABC transporter permease [Streptosporangiaceae bacterium]